MCDESMKARLKINWLLLAIAGLLALLPTASAYYDPAAQRWLNRDPKREEGFSELHKVPLRGGALTIDRGHRIGSKQNFEHLQAFALNTPLNRIDLFGLDAPGCDVIPDSWENACRLECCAQHDECYDNNGCSWLSWFCPFGDCAGCNFEVLGCFADCLAGYSDRPDMPNYYCCQCGEFFDLDNPGDINSPADNPHYGHHCD